MTIRSERNGPVVTIVIDRPERRNAVDRATAELLADAFRSFEADETAKVAVLVGDSGTFCAGADLRAVADGQPNRLEPDGDAPMGPSRMLLSKPVIAAVAGHAVAGGLELALFCDLRIAEEDAVFGVCRRWGVPLIDGGTVRLPQIIGLGRALDLILTGRAVSAEEALQMGLVNRVVPKGRAREAAEALAQELSLLPQTCMRTDRRSAYESLGHPLDAALRHEFELGRRALEDPELLEAVTRFRDGAGRHGQSE